MHILFAFAGMLVGWIMQGEFGLLVGGLVGYMFSALSQQRQELGRLKERMETLAGRRPDAPGAADTGDAARRTAQKTDAVGAARPLRQRPSLDAKRPPPVSDETPRETSAWTSSDPRPAPQTPSDLDQVLTRFADHITRFFTTGNLVVRIGVVVLFIGVAFLLRYAYEHALVPVELRLAGAALAGIVLTLFGWRFRHRSDTYGLILQGAGVGLLYLTIFAAARLYELLPMGGAFALLVALVAAACALAILQKSQALAVFSMSGGFLAPVLVATGTGSHVALFSYYAVLNTGIVLMAWFHHWRWLNWVGFVFTFVIGATWGYQYYRPEYFASTEPFLILFFLYYVAVSVLFARRTDIQLPSLIDGTLVFGTPIVAFSLQAALVRDMEFGLALSALGVAIIYIAAATWLKRRLAFANLLNQSFVALAVVFATLAIPFAFDNQRFTAAAWALEGAGLVWIGLRQHQLLPRAFGLTLQLAAALAFLAEAGSPVAPVLFLNSAFLGAAFLSVAGGFTGYLLSRHVDQLHRFELPIRWLLLGWSVAWWFAAGWRELADYTPVGYPQFDADNLNEHLLLLYAGLSLGLLTALARRFDWREGLLPGFLLLPLAALTVAGLDLDWQRATLLTDVGWLAWPVILLVVVWHLRLTDDVPRVPPFWHAGTWWFVTLWVTWNAAALAHGPLPESIWSSVIWGAVPLGTAALVFKLRHATTWPFGNYKDAYFGWGWAAMLLYLIGWLLLAGQQAADPRPLPYLVILNPLELIQLAVILLAIAWARTLSATGLAEFQQTIGAGIGVVGFFWINLTAARAVHFYADVDYPLTRILASDTFQTTASILWTCVALVLMGVGARRSVRVSWLAGAALLALVIVKLFTVDLSRLDTVARITSFITVGVLMLVIGYFAPLPPARTREEQT